MANIFDVAKYILNSVGGDISTMKLQKLCYYSQAWSLAWGETLFNEDFEAWSNGPVCRELFNIHKGKFYLTGRDIPNNLLTNLTNEEKYVINKVIETYGKYSGSQLSELIHEETPWKNTEQNQIINKEMMGDFYRSL